MENKTTETKKEVKIKEAKNFYNDFNFKFDVRVEDINEVERMLELTSSPFFWSGYVNLETDAKPLWEVQRDFEVEKSVEGFNFQYADLAEIKRISKKIDARISISIVGDKDVEYSFGTPKMLMKTFIFCVVFEGAPYYGRPLKIEKRFAIEIKIDRNGSYKLDYANGAIETYAIRYMFNSFLSIAGIEDPEQKELKESKLGIISKKTKTVEKVLGTLKDVNPEVFSAIKGTPYYNLFINLLKEELGNRKITFDENKLLDDKKLWEDLPLDKFNSMINIIKTKNNIK